MAIASFLFNWPSTGGGIIHTVELAQFLTRAGYLVRLIHPRFAAWGIGRVETSCPFPTTPLEFDERGWTVEEIKARFRGAVDEFQPDVVIITDCWNFKPHLADAVRDYPYFLRLQAQECLCPLNNLRLQPITGGARQCPNHQFRSPETCYDCLRQLGRFSGGLHQVERALSDVGSPRYLGLLRRSFREAAGVLVLNRAAAETLRPYCGNVRVVTWGMDPERFPEEKARGRWLRREGRPGGENEPAEDCERVKMVLFAGLIDEQIKGFDVLYEACRRLWDKRRDFELIATAPLHGRSDEFLHCVGWKNQSELPDLYGTADITVVPTIAQEGLSRTAVEAMASGCPVIGSRIGGLLDTIDDEINGLFAEPGDASSLAERIEYLLDRPDLREQFGTAGRKKFERQYTWPAVIERQYRPMFEQLSVVSDSLSQDSGDRGAVDNGEARGALAGTAVRSAQRAGSDSEFSRAGTDQAPPRVGAARCGTAIDAAGGARAGRPAMQLESDRGPRLLKVLFLENFGDGKNQNQAHIADTLVESGHRVTRRNEFAVPTADALIDELDNGDFDCFLFGKGRIGARTTEEILYPTGDAIADVLRRSRRPGFLWYGDKVTGFEPSRARWMRKVAPLCRLAFVTDGELAQCAWAPFRLLRQGVLAQTVERLQIAEENKKGVAFIGSVYGERAQELSIVRPYYDVTHVADAFGKELSRIIQEHRIVLGPRYPSSPGYWSDRVYVVLGHGGFFLAPEIPGMSAEGLVAGVHYAPLGNDPVADVAHWLARPEERQRIARAGQELALGRFTYHHRLRELCGAIQEALR